MRIKDSLPEIIGKIISGIVVANTGGDNARSQLFLVFSDGTALEFWADQGSIAMAKGLEHSGVDQIVEILEKRPAIKIQVFRAPHEDPDARQRDMLTDDGV